jgi:hypothetical protein
VEPGATCAKDTCCKPIATNTKRVNSFFINMDLVLMESRKRDSQE